MASIFGRSVIVPLTNKSGGGVVLGDVVVVDTSTDESFTTTTSAASTSAIGVAAETIASNAVGRIIVGGYASLVNVNAAVTRNQFGTTHTVAKQATGVGARVAGTFCRWLKSSATPSAYVYPVDLAGAALTNPMSAIGDIIQGTTAGAPAALAAPLAGKVLTGAGVTTPLVYSYPPGYEFDHVEITSSANATATTEGTANAVITGNAVAFDGSTPVIIIFQAAHIVLPQTASTQSVNVWLYDDTGGGAASIGRFGSLVAPQVVSGSGGTIFGGGTMPFHGERRLTPSNATHTYSVRVAVSGGTATVAAGAGGNGAINPSFLRIIKR